MKKIFLILGVICLVAFQAWRFLCGSIWSSGWEHYKAGGGVFIYDELDRSEMSAAVGEFRRLGRWNPLSTKAKNYEGKALIDLGEYSEAIDAFDSSLSIRSNFTAHYRKAYALMKLKRYDEMKKSLLAAESHESDFSRVARFEEEFGHLREELSSAGIQQSTKTRRR